MQLRKHQRNRKGASSQPPKRMNHFLRWLASPTRSRAPQASSTRILSISACELTDSLPRWSKKDNHHLTDALLTLIEESDTYRVAFGFEKASDDHVPGTGQRPNALHRQIAKAIFVDDPSLPYTDAQLPQLELSIKNRIGASVFDSVQRVRPPLTYLPVSSQTTRATARLSARRVKDSSSLTVQRR